MKREHPYQPFTATQYPGLYAAPSAPLASHGFQKHLTNDDHKLQQFRSQTEDVLKDYKLSNHKAHVALALDISGSMENPNRFYSSGKIQTVIEKALSIAQHFSVDQDVDIFPFGGTTAEEPEEANIANYQGMAQRIIDTHQYQRQTNYAAPINAILQHYFPDNDQSVKRRVQSALPVFVIFVTDGDCNEEFKKMTLAANEKASFYPVFFKFIALHGTQDKTIFNFLQHEIAEGPVRSRHMHPSSNARFVDNADLVVLDDPNALTIRDLVNQYPEYLSQIYHEQETRLLTENPGVPQLSHAAQHYAQRVYDDHDHHKASSPSHANRHRLRATPTQKPDQTEGLCCRIT